MAISKLIAAYIMIDTYFCFEFFLITGAKRTLLLGMTGMIADAEKQRKQDALACEAFTKCKAEKSRYKNPVFVYSDIETGNVVASEEYEQRYCNVL